MLNEIWMPIKGLENLYQISNLGKISNYKKILKPFKNNSGYLVIDLHYQGSKKKYLVHRLVAENFLPKSNKSLVNHIDGNKENNQVTNLEWCTNSENILHARRTGLNPYNYPTKGLKLGKTSSYTGVGFDKSRNKWYGSIRVNGKNVERKRFDTEEEAALWVNYLIDKYHSFHTKNQVSKCPTTIPKGSTPK